MDYLSVAEARELPGMRLVLSANVPGPWGEAAKAVLRVRSVDFTPVAQKLGDANDELQAWTGVRNAPVAVYDSEPPLSGWLDILMLAERLGSGPSLLPESSYERALTIGLSAEICAPGGLGWSKRLLIYRNRYAAGELPTDLPEMTVAVLRGYGYSVPALNAAEGRIVDILGALSEQLSRQRAAGHRYLVGDKLSACDLYWACFSMMLDPLPESVNPMPDAVRAIYADNDVAIANALVPELIAHRDYVYQHHIGLPLDF